MKLRALIENFDDKKEKILRWIIENELNGKISDSLLAFYNRTKDDPIEDFIKNVDDGYPAANPKIEAFVKRIKSIKINEDGTVSIPEFFPLYPVNNDFPSPPPFKFKDVMDFQLSDFPVIKEIPSWFPESLDTLLIFDCSDVSLHNIHRTIKTCNLIKVDGEKSAVTKCILGLTKIKGLEEIELPTTNQEQLHLEAIVNKYLPEGDIFELQDELEKNGFNEQAKI